MYRKWKRMHVIYAHHHAEFTRHRDQFAQWQIDARLRIEARLIEDARRTDKERSWQEFEMRQRRHPETGRKWIENQLIGEARAADRLLMIQEFEAREAARGVNLEELYKRENDLQSKSFTCFTTAPLKITVARGGPIAKKHHRVRLKMGGQKPVACDQLGFLPN